MLFRSVLLFVGLLGSRRERLLVIESADGDQGGLYAKPRAISQMAREETAQASGVIAVKRPKVKLRRSGRGRKLKIRASRGPDPDLETVDDAVHARIDGLAESLNLTPDVRVKLAEPKDSKPR